MSCSGGGIRLDSLPRDEVKQWINSFDTVLADCDGVLWIGSDVLGEAPLVMNRFKELGKGVFFVTNNSTKSREEFAAKAVSMNFNVGPEEILSSSFLAAQYLHCRGFDKEVYIVGSSGIARELDAVNISHHGVGPEENASEGLAQFLTKGDFKLHPNIGAVIVGFDEYFSFKKLLRASSYLDRPDCLFVATNTDERFPSKDAGVVIPGSGSLVRAVETASERKAIVMGKPFTNARDILVQRFKITPERTLMIGDRANTDILFGRNCGFKTLLVETGIHKESDVRQWQQSEDEEERKLVPDFILASLSDLLKYLD